MQTGKSFHLKLLIFMLKRPSIQILFTDIFCSCQPNVKGGINIKFIDCLPICVMALFYRTKTFFLFSYFQFLKINEIQYLKKKIVASNIYRHLLPLKTFTLTQTLCVSSKQQQLTATHIITVLYLLLCTCNMIFV